MLLQALIERSTISYIHLVKDTDREHDTINWWYEVELEIPDDEVIQTVTVTVSFDPDCKQLTQFLKDHNWYNDDELVIQNFDNETGQIVNSTLIKDCQPQTVE